MQTKLLSQIEWQCCTMLLFLVMGFLKSLLISNVLQFIFVTTGIQNITSNYSCMSTSPVGTSHSPNAQSLLLRSTWEHPTVQHTILTPSVKQTTFTPNSMQRRCGIYTLQLTVTAADVRARARV
jgi:hypothetical protein